MIMENKSIHLLCPKEFRDYVNKAFKEYKKSDFNVGTRNRWIMEMVEAGSKEVIGISYEDYKKIEGYKQKRGNDEEGTESDDSILG